MSGGEQTAFKRICTPGRNSFYILSAAYAPECGAAPAQVFMGEWTGSDLGADIGVWEPESGRWSRIAIDGIQITSHLFVDPYRPVVYLSGPEQLFEIDRLTLAVRPVAEVPRQYTGDVDSRGRFWLAKERGLFRYDPSDQLLAEFPKVTEEKFYYPEGTHMVHGVAPDGRIWLSQGPLSNLAVFDPETRTSKTVWDHTMRKGGDTLFGPGTPLVIGDLLWSGSLFVDLKTDRLIEAPFPIGKDGYEPLMRHIWCRTPTAHVVKDGRVLVTRRHQVGWLEPKSGEFESLGSIPDSWYEETDGVAWTSLHQDRLLIGALKTALVTVDLKTGAYTRIPLGFKPAHPQALFNWSVGPDNRFYASGYSHELWSIASDDDFINYGNIVRTRGGELFHYAFLGRKVYVASYTGSVLTRVDLDRPADQWGTEPRHNPRRIIDLVAKAEGQHRPSAMTIAPDGKLYYISRSDYCTRREGALVEVDTETDEVLAIVDPLIPGEQLWTLAASPTRPELYIGTGLGTFVVWNTQTRSIVRQFKFPFPEEERVMTSSEIHIGGIRYTAVVGDWVVGNEWGTMRMFTYHADTGAMAYPARRPEGRVVGVYAWEARDSFVLFMDGKLMELRADGKLYALYEGPLPGGYVKIGSDGRIYLSDRVSIYGEAEPKAGGGKHFQRKGA